MEALIAFKFLDLCFTPDSAEACRRIGCTSLVSYSRGWLRVLNLQLVWIRGIFFANWLCWVFFLRLDISVAVKLRFFLPQMQRRCRLGLVSSCVEVLGVFTGIESRRHVVARWSTYVELIELLAFPWFKWFKLSKCQLWLKGGRYTTLLANASAVQGILLAGGHAQLRWFKTVSFVSVTAWHASCSS